MRHLVTAILAVVSVTSSGCGKDDPEPVVPTTTCNMPARARCDEYSGFISIMNLSHIQFECASREGVFSTTAPCPPPPQVGTCSIQYVFGSDWLFERYYPPTDSGDRTVQLPGAGRNVGRCRHVLAAATGKHDPAYDARLLDAVSHKPESRRVAHPRQHHTVECIEVRH